ncbi:MAG: bifunctional phosphoribosylaminoimidazolecarboxamide formyltransferase/IMP cyclohydrolase [Clostridia bacterium]|nr:bifunctional phosphoribosylaminoimidazolecarboxamide formyltransferase/IMP cyclohydrolase [Clostridia bacterium]
MEQKKRALVSVYDKTNIVEFCKYLTEYGYEIVSTGGTAKVLSEGGVDVIPVSALTGTEECLGGIIKTLHPKVYAGLLADKEKQAHMQTLAEMDVTPIDMLVVNLTPFKEAIMRKNCSVEEAIDNIDVGGPSMLRAAAKNYTNVTVIVDPKDYQRVLCELAIGRISTEFKKYLQYKVFAHTAVYDSVISNYLANQLGVKFPEIATFAYRKTQEMRYGENPHQRSAFYIDEFVRPGSLPGAKQLWGKELSYNNISDTEDALCLIKEFEEPTVVISKHANPVGVGSATTVFEAFIKAYEADPDSTYGGVVAANVIIDARTAEAISKIYVEIIIAVGFTPEAMSILTRKENIRILELPDIRVKREADSLDTRKVYGGLLVQEYDDVLFNEEDLKIVTKRAPTVSEMKALLFNWKVVKHTKSDAIVIGVADQTKGIGMGQTNRFWAVEQALSHAGELANGAVMASDAFLASVQCVEAAHKAGIRAIIQPCGYIDDKSVIEACDKYDIAMVSVGMRHFKR